MSLKTSASYLPQVWLSPLYAPEQGPLPLNWLDDEERDRYRRFKQTDAAQRFLLGRVILKSAIADIETIPPEAVRLSYSPNGKPYLSGDARPFFSISHSAQAVAVAVAPFAVGLDLETVERHNRPWARPHMFLHPKEADLVVAQASDRARAVAFTRCWTCQEAAIKLLDRSVFQSEARVYFTPNASGGWCCSKYVCFSSWWPNLNTGAAQPLETALVSEEDGRYLLTLAAAQPIEEVVFRRWPVGLHHP